MRLFILSWFLLGGTLSAQSTTLLAAPAERGIVLRWVWGEGARPSGYFVERRSAGGPWARLTLQPITRLRERAAARALMGPAFERYQGLLFPSDPRAERADPDTYRGMLLLAADLEPGAARVLGLRYDDGEAAAGGSYEYRLVALTDGGERILATSPPVVAGGYKVAPAPDGVRVVPSPRGAAVRWSAATRFSGYHIYRGTRRDGAGARRLNDAAVVVFLRDDGAVVEASTTFFTDSTAAPSRDSTFYWVAGVDAFGRTSARSTPAPFAWHVATQLPTPLGVQARALGDTVHVTWLPAPDSSVTEYQVWRAATDTGPYTRLGSRVRAARLEQHDPDRPERQLSWYRVTALDAAGRESAPSPTALAEVPDLTPPAVPESLAAVADTGKLSLRWRRSTAPDLRGYRVYRSSTTSGTFGLLSPVPQRVAAFTDTVPVRADHPFYYRVTAVDSAFNESAPSAVIAVRPPDVTAPSAPRIARVRALDGALAVTWLPNPEPDVVAYRVRFRVRGEAAWQDVPSAAPVATLADTIPGLAPGRAHDVTVVAVDDAGNRSAPAPVVSATPVRRRPPEAPDLRRVAHERATGGVVVEWSRPANGARAIVLRREAEGAWRPVAELSSATTRFVDRLARPGKSYQYQVLFRDAFGNESTSRTRRVTVAEGGR